MKRTYVSGRYIAKILFTQSVHINKRPEAVTKCRDGAVIRALASHQYGPGSIPRSGVICGFSLLVLFSAPRVFLRELRFPLSSKNQKFDFIVLLSISSANENNPIDICAL